jgi:MarR family transcriptional regulator, 2-MHQ and catechol-resistance regulon repressor
MTTTLEALRFYVVLQRAAAAINGLAQTDIAQHGLTEAEFAALEALHHKGPLLLRELQKKVLVSSGGMTYVVDRLVGKGLVERRPCTTDRRATFAALTAAGERLMRRIFPAHAEVLKRAVAGLSRDELRQATALLRQAGHYAEGLAGSTS